MPQNEAMEPVRRLKIVLGDQLDHKSAAFDVFDPTLDAVVMMEVTEEASYVPQHKARLVLFFSAMRHFRDELRERGFRVLYSELDGPENRGSFREEITRWVMQLRPELLVVTKPGDHRVEQTLRSTAALLGCPIDVLEDRHFLSTPGEFAGFAEGRKTLQLEAFYRRMRRQHQVLMDGEEPVGDRWNFDTDNREPFGSQGPGLIAPPASFSPDRITRNVMAMVERRFPDAPGSLVHFDYPVTREQAKTALADFVEHRLPNFGRFQDAMVRNQPFLYHSRLSCVLNLHLLDPRDAIDAACEAYEKDHAPLAAVEGFVRQILGWREYVRGIYWLKMPDYATLNALNADLPMPAFMWSGDTELVCIRQSIGQLIDHAYAHHIQRLMVLGLFAMLLGVRPYQVHQWHMSMYADAIDWVSLPNVLGMSQYGDGGIVGSKPYAASGNYISRMSDYCGDCSYDPKQAVGPRACPFTTLYWDFLERHRERLAGNQRMRFQVKNLDRKDKRELRTIAARAASLKTKLTERTYL